MTSGNGHTGLWAFAVVAAFLIGGATGAAVGYVLWEMEAAVTEPTVQPVVEAKAPVELPPPEPAPLPEPEPTPLDHLDEEVAIWPARHLFVSIPGTSLDTATRILLRDVKPGGVVLLADNIRDKRQTTRLVKDIKEAVGLGEGIAGLPLIAIDQEGGPVNRLQLADAPSAQELGRTYDPEAARAAGKRYAEACRERGIGIVFAPVLDVYEPGAHKRFEPRSFGGDTRLVTTMGLSFAAGLMEGGVIPVAKHFPGHGGVTEDSHEMLPVVRKNKAQLAEMMFPFNEAVNAGIPGIMVGHLVVPALDDADSRPASLSKALVQGILRERWAYAGVVLTDDLAMGAITSHMSEQQAVVQALAAGSDAALHFTQDPVTLRAICKAVSLAVDDGLLPRRQLIASMKRLDQWQAWLREPQALPGPVPELPPALAALKPMPSAEEPKESLLQGGTYIVETGDTLTALAVRFNTTVASLRKANGLYQDTLLIGRRLRVPTEQQAPSQRYTVAPGDTLYSISRQFEVPLDTLLAANDMDSGDTLISGSELVIP